MPKWPTGSNRALTRTINLYSRATMDRKHGARKHHGKGGEKRVNTGKPGHTGKWYPAENERRPLRRRFTPKPTKLRASITAGTVLILLAGRFRGKRVVFLKQLPSGLLLVTGPYKVNGVPLRRVAQAYTIATSTKVDVSKVDVSSISDDFFAHEKASQGKEDRFYADQEPQPVEIPAAKKEAQKKVDAALLATIKATPMLRQYLNAHFSLSKADRPHEMKF